VVLLGVNGRHGALHAWLELQLRRRPRGLVEPQDFGYDAPFRTDGQGLGRVDDVL